jgi:hypothetical protein
MQILKTCEFARWARKEGLPDAALKEAAHEIERGLVDATLGGEVCKKRVALQGRGKRGGARTLIAFRSSWRVVYLYGYAKNERDNVTDAELVALRKLAKHVLSLSTASLRLAVEAGELMEIES